MMNQFGRKVKGKPFVRRRKLKQAARKLAAAGLQAIQSSPASGEKLFLKGVAGTTEPGLLPAEDDITILIKPSTAKHVRIPTLKNLGMKPIPARGIRTASCKHRRRRDNSRSLRKNRMFQNRMRVMPYIAITNKTRGRVFRGRCKSR